MLNKHNWNEIFKELDCDTYNPKGQTFEEGLHCFTIILHFLQLTGHDVKFEDNIIEDLTQDNINEKWKEDPQRVVNLCLKYFDSISREITLGEMKVGDVLICQVINKDIIPVIYCGNGKVFTMLEQGTVRISLAKLKILSVHRANNI